MIKYIAIILFLLVFEMGAAQKELSTQHPAYQTIDKVYKKICKAAGDYRAELPQLVVMERVLRVASYRSYDNKLIVEKKAFDICQSLGKDKLESALAFLIGHELTHFYQKHDWEGKTGESGFGTHFLMDLEAFSEHVHHEEEADTYGAFVAYLAGYEVLEIIPEVLDAVYKGYALEDKMINYPSLQERKAVSKRVESKIQELITIYDKANYFTALSWYIPALSCYNHLLKFVKTKELYNNVAILYFTASFVQEDDMKYVFIYPIDMALNYNLRDYSFFQGKAKALKNAENFLLKAIELDPNYHRALLNLACVYDAQGELKKALSTLQKIKNPNELEYAEITIVKGIIVGHQGEKAKAKALFETVTHEELVGLAELSIKVLEGIDSTSYVYSYDSRSMEVESLLLESSKAKLKHSIVLETNDFFELKFDYQSFKQKNITQFKVLNKLEDYLQIYTLCSSSSLDFAKTQKVALPKNIKEFILNHSKLGYTMKLHSKGYFFISRSKGIILSIDKKNRIQEWVIFDIY